MDSLFILSVTKRSDGRAATICWKDVWRVDAADSGGAVIWFRDQSYLEVTDSESTINSAVDGLRTDLLSAITGV